MTMSPTGLRILFGVVFALAIGVALQIGGKPAARNLPSFSGATGWLNSPPLTPAELRGKVVLVDFWTFTCINWLRTLPYLRAWNAKYKNQPLVIVGVHTPEFSIEKDVESIRRSAKEMGVEYPIAIDSDYAVWRTFDNEYWPALYVFDAQGHLRHRQFGEGGYERTEQIIQQLLAEAGARDVDKSEAGIEIRGIEEPADPLALESPETYVGHARAERFASPGGAARDVARSYDVPKNLALNQWALAGEWTVGPEAAVSSASNGRIVYRFHARDVNVILARAPGTSAAQFRVRIDGKPPGDAHGLDVDDRGLGTISVPRLYQLVRQRERIVDRRFEIEFLEPGARVFSFTFG
jgi:thiol-disulfide isomerase/thioredoxin